LYAITDEVAAWCFDRAIYLFGISLDNDLDKAVRGAKNPGAAAIAHQRVMASWVGTKVQYRDPAASAGGRASSAGAGPVTL
jgi:hypothetical protein